MEELINVEVMENENNEVVDEIVPIEAEVFDETSESDLSKRDMVIGGVVLGLATAGVIALGKCVVKGGKAIITKFKDRAAKKGTVEPPATEPIDEKPVEVHLPETEQVEVVNETE